MAAGVSILSDLPFSPRPGHRRGAGRDMDTANMRIPTAKYTKMGETLRHVIPGHMQCSMACGGKACKYENPSRWSQQEQAIKGLYSSWITDNLLAMARPSTEIMEKYNVIEQFQRCGVKTVINLQRPGEHASCGNALEAESGFTYRPEAFMEAAIYYYNFGWKDYGVASLTTILDMVKVMSFAVQEGKMAVHCHAGLGRTGVLLACYLLFTSRMSADQAILFVRAKRPNSIQTRGQLLCVREFAQFLVPLRSVFSCAEPRGGAVTLSQYLTRQRHLLHGYEARQMKNVPKPVQLLCRLLLDVAADRRAPLRDDWLPAPDLAAELEKTVSQQALQQLGKEMRGKGIHLPLPWSPVGPPGCHAEGPRDQPLVSDSELDPLWRLQHGGGGGGGGGALSPSLCAHRTLCYSDSALHKLGARRRLLEALRLHKLPVSCLIKHSLSHSSLASLAPQDPRPESPSIQKWLQRGPHSLSLDLCDGERRAPASASPPPPPPAEEESEASEVRSAAEVPCITLQSELSPDSRRLLVAKALAMELHDKDLSSKVSHWQTELNSREGAWERLCVERDPLVLSALMWSWLEQLREPVISSEDVRTIRERKVSPHNALDSLDKGHRLTLLCILDCAAHLLPMPEEVETSFLHQTIKMFTKMDALSEKNRCLYAALSSILTPILHQLRHKAAEPSRECST